jgi:hypothetical protein
MRSAIDMSSGAMPPSIASSRDSMSVELGSVTSATGTRIAIECKQLMFRIRIAI